MTPIPTWLFWTSLPFTIIGVLTVVGVGCLIYASARGMQRGL